MKKIKIAISSLVIIAFLLFNLTLGITSRSSDINLNDIVSLATAEAETIYYPCGQFPCGFDEFFGNCNMYNYPICYCYCDWGPFG